MAWRIYPDSWEYWECTLIFHVILNTQSNFISKLGLVSNKLWEKERATCSHGHSQKREGTLIYCWPTPHALQKAGYPSISVNGPHGLRKRAIRKLEEHFNFTPSHDIRDFNIFQQPLPAAAGPHNLIIGEYGQVYRIGDDHNWTRGLAIVAIPTTGLNPLVFLIDFPMTDDHNLV